MVVSDSSGQQVHGVHNIMGGIENTGDVRLHNHRRKLKQRFDLVKKLGQGTYGKVQLGINKETGQEVAIKTIRKCKIETEADLIRIRREIQIMSSVRHPNIIHIYEVFENREKMVLVMEYAAGGELYDYLSERKVLSEEEARRIFRQIATAVYYCHKHNICHRDLKLENILLDEIGNAKIADFGLSNVFSFKSLLSTFCGSPLYASPEIVKGTPYHGPEVDCWSLGVLLYTLVYGAMPFDGSNFKRLVKQISQGNYFEPKNPSPASTLIGEMLNVNPARRADITAICSHRWINETYKEMCLDLAEELASQTPVRLDLLLSLTAPAVNPTSIVVDPNQIPGTEGVNGTASRPVRSQSLGSIPPIVVPTTPVIPFPVPETKEIKEIVQEEKKPKTKKKERSHSRTRRRERSRSRSRKSESKESQEEGRKGNDESVKTAAPLVNSGTQILSKTPSGETKEASSITTAETGAEIVNDSGETVAEGEIKPKPVERRRSKIFEVAEKFNTTNEKPTPKVPPPKKIVLPGINVDDARKEFEKRTTSVSESNSSPKKNSTPDSNVSMDEEQYPLASTVALNKLVESAFRDELPFDTKASSNEIENTEGIAPRLLNSASAETSSSKAATLPRRKMSRAEIQLITPQLPSDNYKTEVEHFINKPAVNHKTEIVFPVNSPLPPKPLTKQDNQSKEHVIPIQIEQETPRKIASPSSSWTTSKSSIPRTSSSSLSRQSTVDSDSGSTISTGEPIRKSPREVIIPIAVEGGGFVTPSEDTLTRMNSMNDSEDESRNGSRCFTLRSTKRRQPEKSQTAQLDTADSLSSDEDDNFQLLTAENLFSTLLSRVRSLTQRLNNDEMRRSSAFPRSLFAQHGSLFDNIPRSRITETRSFSRPESAPWRRTLSQGQVAPQRDDSIRKRYSSIIKGRTPQPPTSPSHENRQLQLPTNTTSVSNNKSDVIDSAKERETSSSKETNPSKASLSPKANIEDEFDKFFSKYKRPGEAFMRNYSRTSPIGSPVSANTSRSIATLRRSSKQDDQDAKPNTEEKSATKPPRKSRFLRPDFYDTPREESKYVIQNEKVRAFRERSLSRQRDLSRNRSANTLTNGWNNDYLRSKTCSITDKMDTLKKHDFRRTISEDRTSNGDSKCELIRSNSRTNDSELEGFQKAKRKSLILQNELENEVRKTQNMYSKLSGLMSTLHDNETQYEKKLEKLYGLKRDKSPRSHEETNKQKQSESDSVVELQNIGNKETETGKVEVLTESKPEQAKGNKSETSNNYENLSLLDKKYAYFRKLRNSEQVENLEKGATKNTNDLRASTSAASKSSPEKDTCSLTTNCEDVDSDAGSVLSDGTDFNNMNDRIRRRSFYSRFNSYNPYNHTPRSCTSRPLSYSRSMSADVSAPQRPSKSTRSNRNTSTDTSEHDPYCK